MGVAEAKCEYCGSRRARILAVTALLSLPRNEMPTASHARNHSAGYGCAIMKYFFVPRFAAPLVLEKKKTFRENRDFSVKVSFDVEAREALRKSRSL